MPFVHQSRALKWVLAVFQLFVKQIEHIFNFSFSHKTGSQRLPNLEFSNWTLCRAIQGVIVLVISDLKLLADYSLNCTTQGPITITNYTVE